MVVVRFKSKQGQSYKDAILFTVNQWSTGKCDVILTSQTKYCPMILVIQPLS